MLSGINLVCFTASYAVCLALEATRLWVRVPVRWAVMVGFAVAGLFAHTVYLAIRAGDSPGGVAPLSNWYDWYLVAAWIVAAVYLLLTVTRPHSTLGVFLLPLVLGLIGIAYSQRDALPFPRDRAQAAWGLAHGVAVLLGMVAVLLGFAAGVMYLVQSYRLKHKLPAQQGLKLPSLEWLQNLGKASLLYSSFLLALGLLAGIVLNVVRQDGGRAVPWTDPVVISSSVLLAWVLAAAVFEWVYKPAQQGRKVAYLTLASFGFLVLALAMLLSGDSQHGVRQPPHPAAPAEGGRS